MRFAMGEPAAVKAKGAALYLRQLADELQGQKQAHHTIFAYFFNAINF